MTDEILLANYLMILKSTVEVYVHGTIESSNNDIRMLLKEGLDSTLTHQANTYDEMTKNGFYTITNVKKNQIKQIISNLNSKN